MGSYGRRDVALEPEDGFCCGFRCCGLASTESDRHDWNLMQVDTPLPFLPEPGVSYTPCV